MLDFVCYDVFVIPNHICSRLSKIWRNCYYISWRLRGFCPQKVGVESIGSHIEAKEYWYLNQLQEDAGRMRHLHIHAVLVTIFSDYRSMPDPVHSWGWLISILHCRVLKESARWRVEFEDLGWGEGMALGLIGNVVFHIQYAEFR